MGIEPNAKCIYASEESINSCDCQCTNGRLKALEQEVARLTELVDQLTNKFLPSIEMSILTGVANATVLPEGQKLSVPVSYFMGDVVPHGPEGEARAMFRLIERVASLFPNPLLGPRDIRVIEDQAGAKDYLARLELQTYMGGALLQLRPDARIIWPDGEVWGTEIRRERLEEQEPCPTKT